MACFIFLSILSKIVFDFITIETLGLQNYNSLNSDLNEGRVGSVHMQMGLKG